MRNRFLLQIVLLVPLLKTASAAEEIYLLPIELQRFAVDNQIYQKLGTADKVTLYINTITTIDIIANDRARLLGRPAASPEDYQFAAGILCILPWMPPKSEPDVKKMKALRPTIVADAYVSEERREQIIKMINPDLLKLGLDTIQKKRVSPLDVFRLRGVQ